jgi:hypothetical protein
MNSIDCAVCKKRIKDFDHYLVVGYGIPLPQYSICQSCAKPVILFLEQHRLISFTDSRGISWKKHPEDVITEILDLDLKRVNKDRTSAE